LELDSKINYLNGRWLMSAGPGPGPGRDEDPARHPDDWPGNAAAPDPADWIPLPATSVDWMDDEEWAARLASGVDEDEPTDPEIEDGPPDWEGMDAAIAEAREITAAEARDAVHAARMVFDGGFGAVGAAPGRRGPGQPGSSRSFPGEHASPAAAFGSGMALDVAPPSLALLGLLATAAGDDDSYPGASADEIVGAICALHRMEAYVTGRKLAAVAEFLRRRPAEGCGPKGPARMPEAWDEFAARELAWALAESQRAADGLAWLAHHLETMLPGTKAALREGDLSQDKAAVIAKATQFLNEKEAKATEDKLLGRAGRLTPPGLRDAAARAVMEVAPKKARKRREEGAKRTRVERWSEDTGNAALAGRELPPAYATAADQRITAWAKELRAAGLDGDMDVLRSRAFLDLLLGMDSRPTAPAGRPPDTVAGGGAGIPPTSGAASVPPGFCGHVNLTVPLVTALGLANRPGQAGTLGPIDPWLARNLINSAARNPRTTWCVTVTDQDGHAIGHGCARPEPGNHRPRRPRRGSPGPPGGHDPPGPAGDADHPRFSFTATDQHGPPGGYGTWRLSTGIPGQPDLIIALHPIATEECDHRFEAAGHDPGVLLRHLTEVRHARCTAPGCRRPASTCDFEHNIPYEAGGRSCLCNGGPKCRRDHRLKQDTRWKVEQPTPSTFRWTTPTGRQYTTEPTRYPI
jgi:hypothetical protein